MIDLLSATQGAVFRGLAICVQLAPVLDFVKQDTMPPFVQIGTIESLNEGGKHEQAETLQVEIHTIYRGTDRGELLAIMHQVRSLEGQLLEADGVSFGAPAFISAVASTAGPDGITFAGISTFEVFAEPA